MLGSPKTSISVNNLMHNGISYPIAKKIQKKSLLKHHKSNLAQDSLISAGSSTRGSPEVQTGKIPYVENSKNSDYLDGAVQLPQISKIGALASRHASVPRNADETKLRRGGMQIYTTFIRKVNEFKVDKQRDRRAKYEVVRAEPNQWEKYTKYMSMLEEDDGSFPRVSELSMRIE